MSNLALKKRRVKNEKEVEKNQLLFEKVKILHFYWSENLDLLRFQLSKKISKIFLGSTVMTKIFGPKLVRNKEKMGCFFYQKLPLNYYPYLEIQKRFFKIFLIIDIAKRSGFCSNKIQNFWLFKEEMFFFSSFSFSCLNLFLPDLSFTKLFHFLKFFQLYQNY